MNKYQMVGACGEGFYGTVFKCRHKQSDSMVAIKQFKGKEDYATKREIETLSKLKHTNIINLREVFREQGKLHMVFEFLDTDLLNALDQYPKGMPENLVKIYMVQLCRALEYCHQRCVVHRDLKPENLLVAGNVKNPDPRRSLKLCDFGEARDVGPADKFLSGIIGTRWYRAPEILIGAKVVTTQKAKSSGFNKVSRPKLLKYDFQVDMWGAGCIMGELLLANPMFPADTDIQQLEMVQVYGTPQQLSKRFNGKCSATCASALKGLLDISPHKRLTARTALQHQWFGGRRNGKNSLVDAYSPNSQGRMQRPKFQPQFKHGVMGDIDEEIDTESDNSDDEELVDDMDNIPEHDAVDYGYDDDDDDGDGGGDDYYDEPAKPKPHKQAADHYEGYSDDEFDEGYSEDEFEEAEDEPAPQPAAAAVKPAQSKQVEKHKPRTQKPSSKPPSASSTSSKRARHAKHSTHGKPHGSKAHGSKAHGKKPGSRSSAKPGSRSSVKPGSRSSVKPGSRLSARGAKAKSAKQPSRQTTESRVKSKGASLEKAKGGHKQHHKHHKTKARGSSAAAESHVRSNNDRNGNGNGKRGHKKSGGGHGSAKESKSHARHKTPAVKAEGKSGRTKKKKGRVPGAQSSRKGRVK